MTKTVLLATAAVFALSVGGASAAAHKPSVAIKGAPNRHHMSSHGSAGVLYDQNSDDSGIGIVSQNFESSFDAYDNQAADDFKVSGKGTKWAISEVDVTGTYFQCSVCGPASSENVTFYKKGAHHLPGNQLKSFTVDGVDDGFGSFAMTLGGKGQKLKKGVYWVSVQANLDFFNGGEWAWENRADTNGSKAAWENPNGGFGLGCTTWTEEDTCIADGQGDHMFTLRGTD